MASTVSSPAPTLLRFDADAAVDGHGTCVAPASVVIGYTDHAGQGAGLLPQGALAGAVSLDAIGTTAQITASTRFTHAKRVDLRGHVLIPTLVNAHTHLDLSHIGPRPFDPAQGFLGFVRLVLGARLTDEDAIAESVREGARLSLLGGVGAVGDIAGVAAGLPTLAPVRALTKTPLRGVSFVEFFGIGRHEAENLAALSRVLAAAGTERAHGTSGVRLGCSPHAPYTVSPRAFASAIQMCREFAGTHEHGPAGSLPLCTHLAENPEEREFLAHGTGPFRRFLERTGAWMPVLDGIVGGGQTPVSHMFASLMHARTRGVRVLLAHVNDCNGADLDLLAKSGAHVAYCPRSADYFRNHEHFGPHRYRAMLDAGVNVALGTDSIINLFDPGTGAHGITISTLDEARFLFARDGTDPALLLRMATTHGARALGLDPECYSFRRTGEIAGIVAVPIQSAGLEPGARALERLMSSTSPPKLVCFATA